MPLSQQVRLKAAAAEMIKGRKISIAGYAPVDVDKSFTRIDVAAEAQELAKSLKVLGINSKGGIVLSADADIALQHSTAPVLQQLAEYRKLAAKMILDPTGATEAQHPVPNPKPKSEPKPPPKPVKTKFASVDELLSL